MQTIVALILLAIALILFWAWRIRKISNDTLNVLAAIFTVIAGIAAIVLFIVPGASLMPFSANTRTPEIVDCPQLSTLFPANQLKEDFVRDFTDGFVTGFESGTVGRWEATPDEYSNWVYKVTSPPGEQSADAYFVREFLNGCVQFRFKYTSIDLSEDKGSGNIELHLRLQPGGNISYMFQVIPYANVAKLFYRDADDNRSLIPYGATTGDLRLKPNEWYYIRVEIKSDEIVAVLNDELIRVKDPSLNNAGRLSLAVGPNTVVYFDDVKVWKE